MNAGEKGVWLTYVTTRRTDKRVRDYTDHCTTPTKHAERQKFLRAAGVLVSVSVMGS